MDCLRGAWDSKSLGNAPPIHSLLLLEWHVKRPGRTVRAGLRARMLAKGHGTRGNAVSGTMM